MSTGFRYQNRCLKLLPELGELGILDQPMIRRRHFPLDESGRACPKKLRQYEDHGLVLRHDVDVATKKEAGTYIVYRLTNKGADEIERLTGKRPKRAGGTKPPEALTLPHRLGVLHTRLAFDDACESHGLPHPDWVLEWDRNPEAAAIAELSERIILNHSFQHPGRRVSCWPDAAFRLKLPLDPPWELLGHVEYDRSSMTHREILEKLDGYSELLESRGYLEHWPHVAERHVARVLFVCQSEERINNLCETLATHPAGSFVRFATVESLVPDQLLTSSIWQAPDGRRRAILK
jgi:hypothetical protein